MIDWDKPIETVDGHSAKVISRDYRHRDRGVCVLVQIEAERNSRAATYTFAGSPIYLTPQLRNRKIKREGWVNVYPTMVEDEGRVITCIYKSEEEAKTIASKDVIATVKIEWEE